MGRVKKVRVVYKHYKKDKKLECEGILYPLNEQSDRIVVVTDEGVYEDIIKDTIVSLEYI